MIGDWTNLTVVHPFMRGIIGLRFAVFPETENTGSPVKGHGFSFQMREFSVDGRYPEKDPVPLLSGSFFIHFPHKISCLYKVS